VRESVGIGLTATKQRRCHVAMSNLKRTKPFDVSQIEDNRRYSLYVVRLAEESRDEPALEPTGRFMNCA